MKKYLLFFTFFNPLSCALPGPSSLDVKQTLTFNELLNKHSSHRNWQRLKKTTTTSAIIAGTYAVSKSNTLQELCPELFPRSGTSDIILITIGLIAGGGGLWVLRDKLEEWGLRQKATEDMLKSSEILEDLLPLIKEVQGNQAELKSNMAKWGPKIATALDNSVLARKGYETVLASVEKIVADMGDDQTTLGQITALKDQVDSIQAVLYKTRKELGDTTALANETALTHLRDKMADAPNIDQLAKMANELESASKRFTKVSKNPQVPTKKEKHQRTWRLW